MRFFVAALSLCLIAIFSSSANAHARHHRHHHSHHVVIAHKAQFDAVGDQLFSVFGAPSLSAAIQRVNSRPSDCYGIPWCGCYMRHVMGVSDRAYNLARNWAHWGHAGPAGVGAVVVWPHHVGMIVGRQDGEWIIESGNDGHAVRSRPRSIAGAIAIRWRA